MSASKGFLMKSQAPALMAARTSGPSSSADKRPMQSSSEMQFDRSAFWIVALGVGWLLLSWLIYWSFQ